MKDKYLIKGKTNGIDKRERDKNLNKK
jgi:hypothetical protein